MGLVKFLKNVKYLSRYNLKQIYKQTNSIHYALDHIKYEIESDLQQIPNIIIKNNDETLEKLVNSDSSLTRYGDGEISLMFGQSIPSQKYKEDLSQKLKNVLTCHNDNLMIGISHIKASVYELPFEIKQYNREFFGKYNHLFCNFLDKNREYYSAGFTFPYIQTKDKADKQKYFTDYYNKFRKIWTNKDIVVVCGNRVFDNINHNIYDNANSAEYIFCPTNNAFTEYNSILDKIYEKSKDKIIILILGATATVLAYELCKNGYRALDLGHLGKDYDAFCKNMQHSTENVFQFFAAE